MDTATQEELKQALLKEQQNLVAELKSVARQDPGARGNWETRFPEFGADQTGASMFMEESADEVEEYEARLATENSLESRLLEVTHALERIEKGTYGACRVCGKEISIERLRANPAAECDIEHS